MKQFTKLTALLLALVLCLSLLPVSALAAGGSAAPAVAEDETEPTVIASGSCKDTLTWTLTDTGILTVSGTGRMDDYRYSARMYPWYSYQSEIKKVVISPGVTVIGGYAFQNYTGLTEISLPEGLTEIHNNAFQGCSALREIHFPTSLTTLGNYTFRGCNSLTSIYIPASLTKLGNSTFRECVSLKTAVIAGDHSTIGGLFVYCTSLREVFFQGKVNMLCSTFRYCTSLKEITLPEGCEALYYTFRYCTSLERVAFPATVKTIEEKTFIGCTALTDKYYTGSYEQWKQIEIGEKNTYLKRAKLHSYYKYIPYCEVSEPKYSVYAYTGQEIKPLIKVYTVSGTRLKEGTNYTVSYENNIYPGTATITVSGIGKYSGTVTRTFQILSKLQDLRYEGVGSFAATFQWTADPKAARYQVYMENELVGETTDTEFAFTNLDGGSHDVEVRSIWQIFTASGDIEEIPGQSAKIRLKSLWDCRATRPPYDWYHSTTLPRPIRVFTKNGTRLKEGVNYTVTSFPDPDGRTDSVGNPLYIIRITGIGKYYGSVLMWFYYGHRPPDPDSDDWPGDDDDDDQGP